MPSLRSLAVLLLAPALGFPALADAPPRPPLWPVALEKPFPDPAASFEEVRKLLLAKYYSTALTEEALWHAAILGMLRHVSPPNDRELGKLWRPAEYEQVSEALKGRRLHAGVISTIDRADGSLTVTRVLPGSAADGPVRVQDRILRINGERLGGKSTTEIDAMLLGESGERLRLTVVRDIEVLELALDIRPFTVVNLRWEALPGGVGYVDIDNVTQGVAKELETAMAAMGAQGITRAILDLRGNRGGVFLDGMKLAEVFLPAKAILVRTLQHDGKVENFISSNAAPVPMELVALVDRETGSSAEIFAAALRGHGKARIVGTRTYGKATLEETFRLANDWRVKFVVRAMFDPEGKSWHAGGLQPDFAVSMDKAVRREAEKLPVEARLKKDVQLNAAWKLLRAPAAPGQAPKPD